MGTIPMSRAEAIMQSKIDGTSYDQPPQSRVEELLLELDTGGGGTSDYDKLTNKPSINGVTVAGDKNSADYSIGTNDYNLLINKPTINGQELSGDVESEDFGVSSANNTTYEADDEHLILG